jgi:hypothetical protein
MDRQAIIKKVQLKLDEITPYDSGEIVNDSFIDELLDDSAKTLQLKLPGYLSAPVNMDIASGTDNGDGTGFIQLPDDYIRLVTFKMTEWLIAVTVPITEDNPKYNLQKNPYLRGKPNKPVLVIRNIFDSTSKKILEYYSVSSDHTIERAMYIQSMVAELFPDELIDTLAYQTASDAYLIMEQPDMAKLAMAKVDEYIQLNSY